MRGKIMLEEHVCMPGENNPEQFKFFARDPSGLAAAVLDLHGDRLKEMNANGVEYGIMSITPPGPQGIRDPQVAAEHAVKSNNYLAQLVDKAPERFAAFAAVSMHDTAVAVAEITRCVNELAMVGVMIHDTQAYTTTDGRTEEYYYDDPRFDEFWRTVESFKLPVYLHPKPPTEDDLLRLYSKRPWLIGPTYSFARDAGFHLLALCTSGVFDRFPGVKLIVGHLGEWSRYQFSFSPNEEPFACFTDKAGGAGEMIPAHLGRINHWLEKKDRGRRLPCQKTLRKYFETNVYLTTAGNFSTTSLLHAISEVGTDRVLFSVDTPYENITEAAIWFDNLPLSGVDLLKMGRANTLTLFPRLNTRLRTVEVEKLQYDQKTALWLGQAGFPTKL